jgi:hypothetical protein
MAQDDPRAFPAQAMRSTAATPDDRAPGRPRAVPSTRPGQGRQAWSGLLFDAAALARGAVVFMGLAGGVVLVLLALMDRS